MTREEAIHMLYGMRRNNLNLEDAYTKDKFDALTIAIEALEEHDELVSTVFDNELYRMGTI